MPMAEMGQGVYTAASMLLAEELEVGLDQIQVQHAPATASSMTPRLRTRIEPAQTRVRTH
jgi:isoquinoline 1-oxidoreductase subunit beta